LLDYFNHFFALSPQVDAAKSVEEVFEAVKAIFTPKEEKVKHHSYAIL
jgi:UMP-CMP kinase